MLVPYRSVELLQAVFHIAHNRRYHICMYADMERNRPVLVYIEARTTAQPLMIVTCKIISCLLLDLPIIPILMVLGFRPR